MEYYLDLTCRVCLINNKNNESLFEFSEMKSESQRRPQKFSEALIECTKVFINEFDDLPCVICPDCKIELIKAYNFLIKCRNSDKILKKYFNKPFHLCENNVKKELSGTDLIDNELSDYKDSVIGDVAKMESDFERNVATVPPEYNSDGSIYNHLFSEGYSKDFIDNTEDTFNKMEYVPKRIKGLNDKSIKKFIIKYGGEFRCSVCSLNFNSKLEIINHVRMNCGKKIYSCDLCDKHFSSRARMKSHMKTDHITENGEYTCDVCNRMFYCKSDIVVHLRRHRGEAPFQCSDCPRSFLFHATLVRHQRTHSGEKPFPCKTCGKRFADKSMVRTHSSVHSDDKLFTCSLCGKSVKTKYTLIKHMNLHTQEKHNICDQCGVTFLTKGNLKKHMDKLHSEKSGYCHTCKKQFSNLDDHARKHTGETPFQCHICSKCFAEKRSLSFHISRHANANKFKCSVKDCIKSFPMKCMLDFHISKHHIHQTAHICQHCSRGFFRSSDLSRHLKANHMNDVKS